MSWLWLREVILTLLELIMAVLEVPWRWLLGKIPVLLVLDLVGHSFAVFSFLLGSIVVPYYTTPGPLFVVSPQDCHVALALLGFYVVVLVLTAGPLGHMWLWSWEIHRRGFRPPAAARFGLKALMQAHPRPDESARFVARGLRPAQCHQCLPTPRGLEDGDLRRLDRLYHCVTDSGQHLGCLPVLDHYCWWLWVPVALPTIKSYLLFMVWLPVLQTVSLGILAWPLAVWQWQATSWLYVFLALVFPYMLVLVLAAPIKKQWRRLGCMDSPAAEYTRYARGRTTPAFPMCVKRSDGTYAHKVMEYNPWDKGTILNLRCVLGDSVFAWPFWFLVPRRVRDYGTDEKEDLTLSSRFHEDIRETLAARQFSFAMAGTPLQTLPPAHQRRGFSSEN